MGLPSVARSSPRHMLCRTSTDLSIKKPVDGRPPLPRWSLCASATSRGTFRPIGPTEFIGTEDNPPVSIACFFTSDTQDCLHDDGRVGQIILVGNQSVSPRCASPGASARPDPLSVERGDRAYRPPPARNRSTRLTAPRVTGRRLAQQPSASPDLSRPSRRGHERNLHG